MQRWAACVAACVCAGHALADPSIATEQGMDGFIKVTSTKAWLPRLDQGMGTLIDHALNGFVGPKYTQMPARGANPDLSDEEVVAAVLFMVWMSGGAEIAETFINTNE